LSIIPSGLQRLWSDRLLWWDRIARWIHVELMYFGWVSLVFDRVTTFEMNWRSMKTNGLMVVRVVCQRSRIVKHQRRASSTVGR